MLTGRQKSRAAPQPVEHHGVVVVGNRAVEYETRHPEPNRWVATGLVSEPLPARWRISGPEVLIGTGGTEETAIRDLQHQVLTLQPGSKEDEFVVDWALAEVDEPGVPN